MISAFTFKIPISQFMWEVFNLLHHAFFHGAIDYFSGHAAKGRNRCVDTLCMTDGRPYSHSSDSFA